MVSQQNSLLNNLGTNSLISIIDDLTFMVYVHNIKGELIFCNSKAKLFFDHGIEYLDNGEKINFVPSLFNDSLVKGNDIVLKTCERLEFEIDFLSVDSETYMYKIIKSPLKDKDGKVTSVITYAQNVELAKRLNEQRETYIATLSHDLKTPAIAQVRALELLLSGQLGEFNEEQKEMLKLILDSCNYMYEMVYTLLSTCKFESGEIVLSYSNFDLVKVLSDCINEMNNLAKDNSTTLIFKPQVDNCLISADRIQIKRVIINLLSNAINYAFKSTEVVVELSLINDNVELKVQNSSLYMDDKTLKKIFRKYVTHSEKYNKVGMGLGLYLSKQIVEAHNGKIIAKSFKNNKCIFGFSLPSKIK